MKVELFFRRHRLFPGADVVEQENAVTGAYGLKPEYLEDGTAHARLRRLGLRLADQLQQGRRFGMDVPRVSGGGIRLQVDFKDVSGLELNQRALVRIGSHPGLGTGCVSAAGQGQERNQQKAKSEVEPRAKFLRRHSEGPFAQLKAHLRLFDRAPKKIALIGRRCKRRQVRKHIYDFKPA